jgi:hypothetical protein
MFRVTARWVIAFVPNEKTVWNRPVMNFVAKTVRKKLGPMSRNSDKAVTPVVSRACPDPASVNRSDVSPKPFSRRQSQTLAVAWVRAVVDCSLLVGRYLKFAFAGWTRDCSLKSSSLIPTCYRAQAASFVARLKLSSTNPTNPWYFADWLGSASGFTPLVRAVTILP